MNRDVEGLMHQWLGCRKGWVTSQETDILSKLVNQGLKALYVFFRFFGLGKKGLVIICKFGHCCLERPDLHNTVWAKPGETFHAAMEVKSIL